MSDTPEPTTPVDLSDLRMMPKWVADFGKSQPQFQTGDDESHDRPRRDRDRDREGHGRGERRGFGGGGGGPRSGPRDGGRPPFGGDRGRREGGRREGGPPREGGRGGDRRDRGGFHRGREQDRGPRFEAPPVVQGLTAAIEPDSKAVEAMAQMIRTAGKAYSVFDAAKLVLSSGDRFDVAFTLDAPGAPKFTTVPADGSVWLSREEALSHLMQSDVLPQFYRVEEIELEEPKGNFASIGICGFSGELLGPPSHHSYQTTLHRLHRERFSNMPFEDYKRRVRTDSSPEVIEKWKESQKKGVQWVDLKAEVPEGGEAPRFKSRAEMESHFRTHYANGLLGETARATVAGNIPKKNLPPALYFALRKSVDEARKHLLGIAQQLCSGFEKQGLKLFKRRGGKLWVSRTRPRLLDSSVVLSDRISRMVDLVKAKPGITTKQLIETVAPGPAEATPTAAAAEAPAETPAAPVETAAEGAPAAATPAAESGPSPLALERMQALKDLHWLSSEGYLIEYSDGIVFIGVTEPPPAKPKAPKPAPAGEAPAPEAAATEPAAEALGEEAATEEAPVATAEEAPAPAAEAAPATDAPAPAPAAPDAEPAA